MFELKFLKGLLLFENKRRDSVCVTGTMKPILPFGGGGSDPIPCRIPLVAGITCVVGVIGSALLLLQGVKYFR